MEEMGRSLLNERINEEERDRRKKHRQMNEWLEGNRERWRKGESLGRPFKNDSRTLLMKY